MEKRLPPWLRRNIPDLVESQAVGRIIEEGGLHTVCKSARCPNRAECFKHGTATFLIMGNTCTRNCRFCNIHPGRPDPLDPEEPARLAEAARAMGLRYAVVTSVTRDDLPDGGAAHFAETIRRLHEAGIKCEVLTPDFQGSRDALRRVADATPEVFNHNMETVPRLYSQVRPQADYQRSLLVLKVAKEMGMPTKSGLMLGLGEEQAEVMQALEDLLEVGCDRLTLGQYLPPTKEHFPVVRFLHPDEFSSLGEQAKALGFSQVFSGPLVRSSYQAETFYE